MGRGWYYRSGSWNILCDVCAKKIKADQSKKRWDGMITCPACWEIRHPQDFVKATTDRISVPFSRPQPTDVFVNTNGSRANTDTIPFNEDFTKDANIIVTNVIQSGSDTANQSIGSFALGEYPLGGEGAVQGFTQEISFTETFLLGYDVVKTLTDSIGFTEAITLNESEGTYTDNLSIAEAVVVISYVNNALGEISLGSTTLG